MSITTEITKLFNIKHPILLAGEQTCWGHGILLPRLTFALERDERRCCPYTGPLALTFERRTESDLSQGPELAAAVTKYVAECRKLHRIRHAHPALVRVD